MECLRARSGGYTRRMTFVRGCSNALQLENTRLP